MKWVNQDKAKDEGRYLVFHEQEDNMGLVFFKNKMWWAETPSGLVPLPGIQFKAVCKIVRPK